MAPKSIRPSVVLIKENKILVLKSKYSSGEFYLLPGGSIEGMETVTETAIRETKEETNYDIAIKKLLYIQEWIDKKRDKNVMYMVFLGEIIGGVETHLNDPAKGHIQAIEWISPEKLDKVTFYPKDIIPLLKEDIKRGFKGQAILIEPIVTP
jgi:ADP-ribose pyrophosphatase YjhB (NUDIX family)